VLTSLRDNEMVPTEKAAMSRIKEAFALKISTAAWDVFIGEVQGEQKLELNLDEDNLAEVKAKHAVFNEVAFQPKQDTFSIKARY